MDDGQIVLNIGPRAIRDLVIESDYVMFSGRFDGVAHEIYAPIDAVMGIVAKENGEGMWFPKEETQPQDEPPPSSTSRYSSGRRLERVTRQRPASKLRLDAAAGHLRQLLRP